MNCFVSRVPRLLRLGIVALAPLAVLAACFHGGPPSVAPTASLAPAGAEGTSTRSAGPFAVVYAAPHGRVVDRSQPGVTVLFSRGVRSVEMADDEAIPPITIARKGDGGGPVAGAWRWTGTRGLLFTPEAGLPGGSDFVVTVPAGVKALDGAVLERPYTFPLETSGPKVTALTLVGPAGATVKALPADPVFRLELDQYVDASALLAAARLRVFAGDGDAGEIVPLTATRESDGKGAANAKDATADAVLLKPQKKLPLDRQVELTLAPSLRGSGGPRPMGAPVTYTMRTHGPLRFVDFYCPRVETNGRCRARGDVKVVLSNPVAPAELRRHLRAKLPPRPPTKREPRRIDPTAEHWLGVSPKVGEAYKITLTAGMRDMYGETLARDATFEVAVEAPLVKPPSAPPPAASAAETATPPAPPPRTAAVDPRPRRERLPYRLDLGLAGHVLEANVNAGERSHRVPVGSINIPSYATVAAPLTEAQATAWTIARGDTQSFLARNGLTPTWTSPVAAENERAVDFLDLDQALATHHGKGPALVVVAPPGGKGDSAALVTVTDLGLTAKMSPFGGVVWVTQLSTGKPLPGATVTIRTAKEGDVFEAKSDADGLVAVPSAKFDPIAAYGFSGGSVRDDAVIVARAGDDFTLAKVERSAVDTRLTSDFEVLSKEGRWAGMLFADRGVFRPGETAKVSGIVRVADDAGLRSIAGRELRIELKDRDGEQIFDGRAKTDDFGTFTLDVPIPKTAQLGLASIVATAPAGGRSHTAEAGVFTHSIRLLAYTPNEFKVEATSDKPAYVRGDAAVFAAEGSYLYGAPMQGASVTTTIARQVVPFAPPGTNGFTVTDDAFTTDYPETPAGSTEMDSQDGTLDPQGKFARKVSLAFADQRRTERIVFDADVQDLGRRSVSSRASALLHPAGIYVGLRTPTDRFVAAGAPYKAQVVAVEPAGAHRAGVRVKVELVERRWAGVVGEQPDGTPMRSTAAQDAVVGACEAVTAAAVASCDLRVPRAGYFIVRATANDARGNTARASASFYGTEDSPGAQAAWADGDRRAIALDLNKKTFAIGDTARVLLRSPFREGEALVTVERNGVLWRKVVPLRGGLPVVEVPVRPEFYPNAFVSVVAVRGRIQAPPASGADLGAPDFRFGHTELKVDPEAHRLAVTLTEPKREYEPGAEVDVDVAVADRSGAPVASALTFYVVDEGVLALTSYKTPDPLPAFVEPRKLSVFALDSREQLARILPMKAGERVAPLGYEYAVSRNDGYDKGDNGGGGDESPKRADFRTTAFFEAGRKTGADGKAHFHFKLPDNLTTFRIMAVAASADDRFGSGDSTITTFRSLMARPALPRLIRVGDSLEASVSVSSRADAGAGAKTMSVDVHLDARGLTLVSSGGSLAGPASRTITMARGGQAEVRFPVHAAAPGEAVLAFDVRSGADRDRVELKRRVELPVSQESVAVYGETSSAAAIALGDLKTIRRDQGGLDVRVASSALVGLGTSIDRLIDYPYGCTEQLTSRTLPLLSLVDLAKDFGATLPPDVNGAIDGAIEQILTHQNSDGGFGVWQGSPSEPWLSAYAMLAVAGANEKKRFVPADAIDRGRDYLAMSLATATRALAKPALDEADDAAGTKDGDADAGGASDTTDDVHATFATGALIADALGTLGWSNPGALNVLYDARAGQALFAEAALLRAIVKGDIATAQIRTLAQEVVQRLRVDANEADVDEEDGDLSASLLDSHARTLAFVLRGLLAADPHHPLAPRLARKLLALRRDGAWRTTQENSWALLALADYRRLAEAGAGGLAVRAYVGDRSIVESSFPPGSTREDRAFVTADALAGGNAPLSFEVHGDGRAYYAAELKYATATLPTRARDEGLFVQKYVRGISPAGVKGALATIPARTAATVTAGDLVLVDLLFESAEARDQVVLDDPLPAGIEALDYDLDTTSRASADAEEAERVRAGAEPKNATWLGTTYRSAAAHREVRDDRVLTFFGHLEPGMYRVHYLARAASIGSFVAPPTRIEAMYAPEVYGRTAASVLTVTAKE